MIYDLIMNMVDLIIFKTRDNFISDLCVWIASVFACVNMYSL